MTTPWAEIEKEFRKLAEREEVDQEEIYYPGSSTPIPETLDIDEHGVVQDPGVKDWRSMGKTYNVNGESVELFPIGALALALKRSPVTIRKWERKGWLPSPTIRGKHQGLGGRRRLYTVDQIERLILIAYEEGLLSDNPPPVTHTRFVQRAAEVLAS